MDVHELAAAQATAVVVAGGVEAGAQSAIDSPVLDVSLKALRGRQFIRGAAGDELIPAETMRAACAWAPFLLAHYKNALGDAADSDEVKLARRILGWLKRTEKTEATATEIQKALNGGGRYKKDEFTAALDLLVESDWLRDLPKTPTNPKGRRTSSRCTVHPAALA